MASIEKRGDGWTVRWAERQTTADEHGNTTMAWRSCRKSAPTMASARALKRQVEEAVALYGFWEDPTKQAVATIRAIATGWIQRTRQNGAPETTVRNRSSMLGEFLRFMRAEQPDDPGAHRKVDELSLPLLQVYADSLPAEDRQGVTRYRTVLTVEQMWRWAWRMRAELTVPWHQRAALLMRCFGLRTSQVCGLRWSDLDLSAEVLQVRANVRGSKSSRARVVPMPPWLATEIAGWEPAEKREGLLFPRRYINPQTGLTYDGAYRGDALLAPFRRAWTLAGVDQAKWDIPKEGGRGKGSPTHALRRMLRSELIRAGNQEAWVLYFTGQSQGVTAAAYVPETTPEQSPYWPHMVGMVANIPRPHVPSGKA